MARYKLIGAEIQGQDVNRQAVSLAEQHSSEYGNVVYETDDAKEAKAIMDAGGFFRDRDNFIVVTRVVDAQTTISGTGTGEQRAQPFPQKG